MSLNEMKIKMSDGFSIHTIWDEPAQNAIGHIHILHGMAEHIARYEDFIHYLVEQGFAVSGHDHRGHGQTAKFNGKLGHFGESIGFDRIVEDAHEVITFYKQKFQAEPFSLLGHSMGSFIARRYAQMYGSDLDKLICLGTAGDPGISGMGGMALSKVKGIFTSYDKPDYLINKLVFGGFNKSIKCAETSFDWLSTDKSTVEKYINDPYCGFVPSTRFFIDLFEGLAKIHEPSKIRQTPVDLPILLLSGIDDPVGDKGKGVWQVAHQYVKEGIGNVTVMLDENGRHEMLQEINRLEVFEFIKDWVTKK